MKFILLEKEDASVVAFNQRNWEQEYNNLSNNVDRDKKIDEFIDSFLKSHNISTNIGFREALKEQLEISAPKSLSEATNPFLSWIVKYNKSVDNLNEIDNNDYRNLIGVYVNDIILDNDLRGTSSLGTKSIIFNSDLFKQSTEDFSYLVQCFYYLNSSRGAKTFLDKYRTMTSTQKNEFFQRLGYANASSAKVDLDEDNLKYFMLFKDKIYKPRGTLRNAKTISYAISYLDEKIQGKDKEDGIDKDFKEILDDAYNILTKDFGFEKNLIRSLLDVVVKSNKFDASSTSDDIVKFVVKIVGALR